MKIGWLCNGIPGTGGGKTMVEIANRLVSLYHHDVTFYVRAGVSGGILILPPIKGFDEYEESDVIISSDPGQGHLVGKMFDEGKAKKKVWYVIMLTGEFHPWVCNPEYTKITMTTNMWRLIKKLEPVGEVRGVGGGGDIKFWFYSQNHRSNGLLVYPKKAGYTGVELA